MAPINRFLTTATTNENVAIVPPVKAQEHGRCFLLELPGEIRNRIYDFAREDRHVRFQSRQSCVPSSTLQEEVPDMGWHEAFTKQAFDRSVQEYFVSPSEVGEFPFTTTEDDDARRLKRSLRQFRGLTQVCRTIRNEFFPLYQKHTTYRMGQLDIQDYLETVLQKECEEVARQAAEAEYDPQIGSVGYMDYLNIWQREELAHRQRIHRTIFIDYKRPVNKFGICDRTRPNWSIDILPFLLFLATAPHISVRCGKNFCPCPCGYSMDGLRPHLDKLFALHRHPKLLTWLQTCVESVELLYPPHMHIHMKKGKEPQWMRAWEQGDGLPHDVVLNEWMEEIGWQIDPMRAEFACFAYHEQDGENKNESLKEDKETSEEDELFWRYVAHRNWGRRNGRLRKRRRGRPKLERIGRGKGRWR